MPEETRFCTNCRAALPPGASSCEACGVYAGDVYDGRKPRKKTDYEFWFTMFLAALLVAGVAAWWNRSASAPWHRTGGATAPISTRVVGDRPGGTRRAAGAKVSEAEAIRLLRRELSARRDLRQECLAILSDGYRTGSWVFTAVDRCGGTRLGHWRVDGQSGKVSPAAPGS